MAHDSKTRSAGTADSKLYMVNHATGTRVELATVNAGHHTTDSRRNYEPFALPALAADHHWVMMTSVRQYGNTHLPTEARKQTPAFWRPLARLLPPAAAQPVSKFPCVRSLKDYGAHRATDV